jgi:hypothetical protein
MNIPDGCAMFFDQVVRTLKAGTTSKAVKVCGSRATGPTKVNNDVLNSLGFTKLKISYISDVYLGKQADVTLYNGNNYDGASKYFKYTPTVKPFYGIFYNDGSKLNDNVFSFVMNSFNADIANC